MSPIILVALAVCLASDSTGPEAGTGPGSDLARFEFREPQMGTEFQLILYSESPATARCASRAAFDRVEELNARLSDYDPQSELMQLCAAAGGPEIKVSDDLFHLLQRADALAKASEGAFDVTIGPVGRLWRRARRRHELPRADLLAKARTLVGYRNIVLDPDRQTVRLLKPGMKLDLGGIAKGYAADEALKVLQSHGISRALVAAAGDIALGDPPPGEEGWSVAVAALRANSRPSQGSSPELILANRAVSTSGDAEQFVEIKGVRYSHILDPRTGLGLVGRSSATVIALDATTSDSLATALSVLGPEKGMALIESTPGAAAYYVRQAEKGFEVFTSNRWKDVPRRFLESTAEGGGGEKIEEMEKEESDR